MTKTKKTFLILGGAVAGLINGFLGGGGGVVIVSLLLVVMCLDQKQSQATALLIILPLTILSAIVYFLNGSVDIIPTLWVTLGVAGGGILGAFILNKINSNTAKIIFAIVLILGGLKMLIF